MKNPFAKKTAPKESTISVKPENQLPSNAFEMALEQHQLGNLAQADALYRQILQQNPNHADALHFLGVLAYQVGQYEAAIELMKKAVQAEPNAAAVYGNLGLALQASGQWDGAIQSYQHALILQPDFSAAHNNLGLAFQAQGQLNEALNSFQQAILTQPDYIEAYVNKANVLMAQHRMDEAIDCYRQVLPLNPDNPQIYNNLGYLLKEQGHFAEAIENFQHLLALTPNDAENHYNLGGVFYQQKKLDAAVEYFQKAIALKPDYVEAFNTLGIVLQQQGKLQAALESYQQALKINPNQAETHCNLAGIFYLKNDLNTASYHYKQAILLQPDNAHAYYGLGTMAFFQNNLDLAIENYQRALALKPDWTEAEYGLFMLRLRCCDWFDYTANKERIIAAIKNSQAGYEPFTFLAISENAAYQQHCARTYVANHYLDSKPLLSLKAPYRHDKIRLAYLSADFGEHPMTYLMAGLFEKHDRQRFEIIAISFAPEHKSSIGERVKNAFAQFIDVSKLDDYEVALLIQNLEIDIAVDLMGFTAKNRTAIFSYRPAPLQINYLGYPATMGADYIDYIIADPYLIPEYYQGCYTEKVVYLPDCFQANDDKRTISTSRPSRKAAGLPESALVFCSFNNSYKLTPVFFAAWMRILQSVPSSVLWLVADNQQMQSNLRKEAVKQGINPERLIFAPKLSYAEHLARLQLADLFLDSLPFNAGTTTSDALWAGVPIVTCSGEGFAARMAGSLLHAIGLPELVTENLNDYEALALKLAKNPALLAEIKVKLAQNRTTYPLFDTDRFRRHIEAAYTMMWETHQRGEAPRSFSVDAIKI